MLKRTISLRDGGYVHLYKNEKGGYVRIEWGVGDIVGWDYVYLYKNEKGGYVRVVGGGGGYCPTPNNSYTIWI